MQNIKKLLTVKEISELLSLAEITIRKMCSAKTFPYIKLFKGRIAFDPDDIQKWIASKKVSTINRK